MRELFKIKKNESFKLDKIKQDFKDYDLKFDYELMKEKTSKNIGKMIELQEKLYAESKQALLIVLQAIDTGGKDGTIRKVFGPLNPQGCVVNSFKKPSSLELGHDFLWRIHNAAPLKGMIGIFNRSHYEDVLIVKVHKMITKEECKKRYEHIKNFEKMLSDNGTKIIKFYLYITKDEQKRRFEDRLKDKEKNWKFASGDIEERKFWNEYMEQYEDVIENTTNDNSPWYIIPANDKKFRNFLISSIVRKTMEDMKPEFPVQTEDLSKIIIE